MPDHTLPLPDSDELRRYVRSSELQAIYRYLFERRATPPTMVEIDAHLERLTGVKHAQRGRRVRELYPIFRIQKTREARPRYRLVGWNDRADEIQTDAVTGALRAAVLQAQICAMCGRTPLRHGVRLVVDHKVPRSWGGGNDLENLQPLCTRCNGEKKNYFATLDGFNDEIRRATRYAEPQRRIGELLLAFGPGRPVRSDVIAAVANAGNTQEDWQRRLRDLRFIGWDYDTKRRWEDGRTRTYYILTRSAPWPTDIRLAIKDEERRRRRSQLTRN